MSFTEGKWDLLKYKTGHIVHDFFEEGIRIIVMRGPASWCAYIGIPIGHPLAGFDYDDIPINCHYGLTYSKEGKGFHPEGYWWYGWDYAHSGDKCGYDDEKVRNITSQFDHSSEKEWTADEVKKEAIEVVWDFKRLKSLAEKISRAAIAAAGGKE